MSDSWKLSSWNYSVGTAQSDCFSRLFIRHSPIHHSCHQLRRTAISLSDIGNQLAKCCLLFLRHRNIKKKKKSRRNKIFRRPTQNCVWVTADKAVVQKMQWNLIMCKFGNSFSRHTVQVKFAVVWRK